MILINRDKAEEAVRERLRREREPRLLALDVAYMRALERGEDTTNTVLEKESLRNVTEKDLSGLSLAELSGLTLSMALEL